MAVTEKELQEGIDLCKIGEPTPEKMIKLGAYLTVKNHLFGERILSQSTAYSTAKAQQEQAETIYTSGNSEFLWAVRGKDAAKVMDIMDELMEAVQLVLPRMYDSVMRRLSEI